MLFRKLKLYLARSADQDWTDSTDFPLSGKSMRGEPLDNAALGWHGLDGDRRLAFRRPDERGGFPWLTASKLPDLILFTPQRSKDANGDALPTYVFTPYTGRGRAALVRI